ncbi:MAG: ABC transporter permease, partial [Dehalococcoidia bacterium]
TTFFTASAVSPTVAPWETQARTLERLISCPVSVSSILLGDILASLLFGIALSAVPIFIGLVIGVSIGHPAVLVLGIVIASFCFSSLALILSFPATSSPASIMMLSSLIKFPLIFISGIFIPLNELPTWAEGLAYISPLTYFTDLARYCVDETNYLPVPLNVLVLAAFSAVFLVLAIKLHQRTMPKRV